MKTTFFGILLKIGKWEQETHLSIYQGSQGEIVKEICEVFPYVGVAILPEALIIETVNLRDLPALVVASENRNAFRVTDLEEQKGDGAEEGDGRVAQ